MDEEQMLASLLKQHDICSAEHICGVRLALPRYSQSDVHLPSASKVEGVQGHLGRGLADGLCCQQTHGVTRFTQSALPLEVQQLMEAGGGEKNHRSRMKLDGPAPRRTNHPSNQKGIRNGPS